MNKALCLRRGCVGRKKIVVGCQHQEIIDIIVMIVTSNHF
jgi:hypothetical protein